MTSYLLVCSAPLQPQPPPLIQELIFLRNGPGSLLVSPQSWLDEEQNRSKHVEPDLERSRRRPDQDPPLAVRARSGAEDAE
eukprot:765509-Hanusia_phi.AAC.4